MKVNGLLESIPFNSTTELKQAVMRLDEANEREVYTKVPDGAVGIALGSHIDRAEEHKGIWNMDRDHLACIATKRYEIIQHRTGFTAAADELESLGLSVFGRIRNYGDRVDIHIAFKDHVIEVNGDKLNMGIKLHNSYNLSRVFGGELFSFRHACTNGMIVGKVVHCQVRQVHMGLIDVPKLMKDFVKDAIESSGKFKEFVSIAMADTVEWKLAESVLEQMLKIKKYREMILDRLKADNDQGKRLTRWDVYNSITAVATHGEKISASAFDYLQSKAQDVLIAPLELKKEA